MKKFKEKVYLGFAITKNLYGKNEYTVQFLGDDVVFQSVEDAKKFIKEITTQLVN